MCVVLIFAVVSYTSGRKTRRVELLAGFQMTYIVLGVDTLVEERGPVAEDGSVDRDHAAAAGADHQVCVPAV